MFKVIFGAIAGFFASGPLAGILLGLDIIWSLHYFLKLRFKLFKPTFANVVRWVDIGLTTLLLVAGISSPSIAVMAIFAAWTVRVYLRLVLHSKDPNYWLTRYWKRFCSILSAIKQSILTFVNDVRTEAASN